MKETLYVKEVLGFNGMPYSDYNRYRSNRREVWLFYLMWNDSLWGLTSCCHLDEKHLPRVEHSYAMTDEIIELLTEWLRKN